MGLLGGSLFVTGGLATVVISCAFSPVAAEPADMAAPRVELNFYGGAERGHFGGINYGTITPGNTGRPPQTIVDLSQAETFLAFGGHADFRPHIPGWLGASAYRLGIRYSEGSGSTFGSASTVSSTQSAIIYGVAGNNATAISTGASNVTTDFQADQRYTSFELKPSLVWKQRTSAVTMATRFGIGYSSIRQRDRISLRTFDTSPPHFSWGQMDTNARLQTHAVGAVGGIDLRAPLAGSALAVVAGGEVTLDYGWTQLNADSTITTLASVGETASDSRSRIMVGVRGTAGLEWTPLPGLTLGAFGDVRWQSGLAHVAYPQEILSAAGNPTFQSTGPAHIAFDDRAFWGLRGMVRWRW